MEDGTIRPFLEKTLCLNLDHWGAPPQGSTAMLGVLKLAPCGAMLDEEGGIPTSNPGQILVEQAYL